MSTTKHVLRSKAGQFVTVRRLSKRLKLCTVPRQDAPINALSVQVYTNDKKQLAFCFQHSNDRYFPKVVKNALELEKIDDLADLTKDHRFEKYDIHSGEHYGLRSVGDPKQYLHVTPKKQINVFGICETETDCVAVTDEFISG